LGVTNLVVEHPIVFVDVGDIALFAVGAFAREARLFVKTGDDPVSVIICSECRKRTLG